MKTSDLQERILIAIRGSMLTREELFRKLYPDERRQDKKLNKPHFNPSAGGWIWPVLPEVKSYQSKQASLTRVLKNMEANGKIMYHQASSCLRHQYLHGQRVFVKCDHRFPCRVIMKTPQE